MLRAGCKNNIYFPKDNWNVLRDLLILKSIIWDDLWINRNSSLKKRWILHLFYFNQFYSSMILMTSLICNFHPLICYTENRAHLHLFIYPLNTLFIPCPNVILYVAQIIKICIFSDQTNFFLLQLATAPSKKWRVRAECAQPQVIHPRPRPQLAQRPPDEGIEQPLLRWDAQWRWHRAYLLFAGVHQCQKEGVFLIVSGYLWGSFPIPGSSLLRYIRRMCAYSFHPHRTQLRNEIVY